jgi:putative hydrolase of the HAD superfamily
MIRNIIFDMGNVLIKFTPSQIVEELGLESKEDEELLLKTVFHSGEWHLTDLGTMTEVDLWNSVSQKLPEHLLGYAHDIILEWDKNLVPVPGMEEVVRMCKENGYNVYLLSNASLRQPLYFPRIPGSQYFDGTVVSAIVGICKPDREIYEYLLFKYGLKAEECIFIDDLPKNIEAANAVGIHGILFDGDVENLKKIIKGGGLCC